MKRTTLCYIRQKGMWLMLYRNKKPDDPNAGKWIGIGGKIEPGETPDECNAREVFEETGIRLNSAHFHGVIHFMSDTWEDEDMYLYSSDDFDCDSSVCLCDEGDLQWVPEKKLLSLPMWEGDRAFLQKVFDGCDHISMTLRYEGERCVQITEE